MRKALSPIVSVVILVVITISIASMVAPWMYELVTTTANQTGTNAQQQVMCRNAGLDFDTGYGYYGVKYNFSANVSANESDWIKAKIVNTGSINLYGFTIEATFINGSTEEIHHYSLITGSDVPASDPLRPSESAIIAANITYDINGTTTTLKDVKILNSVCSEVAPIAEM